MYVYNRWSHQMGSLSHSVICCMGMRSLPRVLWLKPWSDFMSVLNNSAIPFSQTIFVVCILSWLVSHAWPFCTPRRSCGHFQMHICKDKLKYLSLSQHHLTLGPLAWHTSVGWGWMPKQHPKALCNVALFLCCCDYALANGPYMHVYDIHAHCVHITHSVFTVVNKQSQ